MRPRARVPHGRRYRGAQGRSAACPLAPRGRQGKGRSFGRELRSAARPPHRRVQPAPPRQHARPHREAGQRREHLRRQPVADRAHRVLRPQGRRRRRIRPSSPHQRPSENQRRHRSPRAKQGLGPGEDRQSRPRPRRPHRAVRRADAANDRVRHRQDRRGPQRHLSRGFLSTRVGNSRRRLDRWGATWSTFHSHTSRCRRWRRRE